VLKKVSSTSQGNGLVRFISGGHSSLLNLGISFATTTEIQRQAVAFIATNGTTIVITNPTVVEN
jgi:hypothetical protein